MGSSRSHGRWHSEQVARGAASKGPALVASSTVRCLNRFRGFGVSGFRGFGVSGFPPFPPFPPSPSRNRFRQFTVELATSAAQEGSAGDKAVKRVDGVKKSGQTIRVSIAAEEVAEGAGMWNIRVT